MNCALQRLLMLGLGFFAVACTSPPGLSPSALEQFGDPAHMLFLDGVYLDTDAGSFFRRVKAPTSGELERLVHCISERVGRHLERRGLLVRDLEHGWLARDPGDDSTLDELRAHSMLYRTYECRERRMRRSGLPTASRWARTLAARRSPCRLSRVLVMTSAQPRGPMGSHCMPAWSPPQISATNSNGCAAISRGLR